MRFAIAALLLSAMPLSASPSTDDICGAYKTDAATLHFAIPDIVSGIMPAIQAGEISAETVNHLSAYVRKSKEIMDRAIDLCGGKVPPA